MGAVALSEKDENILEMLQKNLGLPSKSQVIHRALKELETALAREHLSREIARSVQKCGKADMKEHQFLTGAAMHRNQAE